MIATHNTFTYQYAGNMELFARWWRCQTLDAYRQVWLWGVEVCDIRVTYDKRGYWQMCHGLARFGEMYPHLEDVIKYALYWGYKKYRLVYETKGNYELFLKSVHSLPDELLKQSVGIIYKPTWEYIYKGEETIIEHNKIMWHHDWSLWKNIKNVLYPSIKKYAIRNNKYIEDNAIHMYDYIEYMKYEITR